MEKNNRIARPSKMLTTTQKPENVLMRWSLSAITADPGFERALGRRGDKRRRFYNGRLECEFLRFTR